MKKYIKVFGWDFCPESNTYKFKSLTVSKHGDSFVAFHSYKDKNVPVSRINISNRKNLESWFNKLKSYIEIFDEVVVS